jgi:Family of unknown function (DUF5681)
MARKQHKAGGEYPVGFCKTPVHSRFKPGQSGNLKGRPKKVAKAAEEGDEFQRVLLQEIPITKDGRRTFVTAKEAFYQRLLGTALSGDMRAMSLLVKLLVANENRQAGTRSAEPEEMQPTDEALIARFLAREGSAAGLPGSDEGGADE